MYDFGAEFVAKTCLNTSVFLQGDCKYIRGRKTEDYNADVGCNHRFKEDTGRKVKYVKKCFYLGKPMDRSPSGTIGQNLIK